jgi:2-methylcitrate dehydratase PrpD
LVIHFKGTPRNPLNQLDVEAKARKLNRAILSEPQLEHLVAAVKNLEKIDNVVSIGALLRVPARQSPSSKPTR